MNSYNVVISVVNPEFTLCIFAESGVSIKPLLKSRSCWWLYGELSFYATHGISNPFFWK